MIQFSWYELLTASLSRLLDGTQEQAQEQAKIEVKPVILLPVSPVVDIAPIEVVAEPVQAQAKKQAQAK